MNWTKCYSNKELEFIIKSKLEKIENLKTNVLNAYTIHSLYIEIDLAKEQIIKNRDNKIRKLLNG